MRDVLLHGDCLALLKTLEDNSVDALCCDPPAGIAFMGKDWDKDKGGKQEWIAWLSEVMREALRCVKPGGHALVWALPRTSHWTATALEDAGWEIRDVITHTFGSGFPKSHDISKAIDKLAGAEREVVGTFASHRANKSNHANLKYNGELHTNGNITAPATPDAQRWSGYGSALKPASEHWILARKPLAAANLASNVLAWGTGGLNIDASRVQTDEDRSRPPRTPNAIYGGGKGTNLSASISNQAGRWPPNFLLSHAACSPAGCSDDCPVAALDEQAGEHPTGAIQPYEHHNTSSIYGGGNGWRTKSGQITSTHEASEGGVSRFFPVFDMPAAYFPKASRRERNAGCEALPVKDDTRRNFITSKWIIDPRHPEGGYPQVDSPPLQNSHPTVKSLALMAWLVRLICPPDGTVLDCFAGSGSTLVACVQEGFHFIGMEQSEEYCQIARARIAHAQREQRPAKPRAKITRLPKRPKEVEQLAMFA